MRAQTEISQRTQTASGFESQPGPEKPLRVTRDCSVGCAMGVVLLEHEQSRVWNSRSHWSLVAGYSVCSGSVRSSLTEPRVWVRERMRSEARRDLRPQSIHTCRVYRR